MKREDLLKSLENNVSEVIDSVEKGMEKNYAESLIKELWVISEDGGIPKKVRKNAKKALYILKSRGCRIERPERKVSLSMVLDSEPRSSSSTKEGFKIQDSYLTIPDWNSDYGIAFIVSDDSETTYKFHFFLCNHWKGILNDHVENRISKRRAFQIVESKKGFFSPGKEYCTFRLKGELEKNKDIKDNIDKLPKYLLYSGTGKAVHPVLSLGGGFISKIYSEEMAKKVFMKEAASNISLPHDDIKEVVDEIKQVRASRLIVANMSPEQRLEMIVDRFLRTFFTRERLKILQDMVFDVAYYLYNESSEVSKLLVSWGIELLKPDLMLHENPIIGFLVYKHFFATVQGEGQTPGSQLITP
ncbi:MAG: hypothetical protein DRP54_06360 [Spirochaetes bacterium]|nr:MAG: hypothetical protein DRP54_06360 [Spirochaetota bacterium]